MDLVHYSEGIPSAMHCGYFVLIKMLLCRHQTWGQIHLYLKVFKYFFKVFVFDIQELKVFVFKYFPKVFDISNTFQILFQMRMIIAAITRLPCTDLLVNVFMVQLIKLNCLVTARFGDQLFFQIFASLVVVAYGLREGGGFSIQVVSSS